MASIFDVPADQLIEKVAEELKKNDKIKQPQWAEFAKTGPHNERPPLRKDWWYIRTASVLRYVSVRKVIGVSKLRTKYGGKKNKGAAPEEFYKASGNILRKILQQLEAAGLVQKKEKGIHKGRTLTKEGESILGKCSSTIYKPKPKKAEPKPPEKPTVKKPEIKQEAPKPQVKKLPKEGLQTRKERSSFVSQKSEISGKSKTFEKEAPQKKHETKPEQKNG